MAEAKIKRIFGNQRSLGDIILNKDNNSVFANIEGGVFGRLTVSILKNQDGTCSFSKAYTTKEGEQSSFIIGKTFPVKNKAGEVVEGITQGIFGLLKEWDGEKQKNLTSSKDGIQITTHKLKEMVKLGDSNLYKVGYLTGKFCIEVVEGATSAAEDFDTSAQDNGISGGDDEIPF